MGSPFIDIFSNRLGTDEGNRSNIVMIKQTIDNVMRSMDDIKYTLLATPASSNNSAKRLAINGVRSDGFNTKGFPVTIAIGNIQQGTIIGKLNGVIPPTTPIG